MRHTGNGNRNPKTRSLTSDAKKPRRIQSVSDMTQTSIRDSCPLVGTSKTPIPTSTNPKSFSTSTEKNTPKKRVERTSVGRVVNGWKIVDKVQKSEIGKLPHPVYRGICPVCGVEKDQTLAYFRNSKSCGCAQYKRSNQPEDLEDLEDLEDVEVVDDMEESYNPRPSRRKQGSRKPGVLVRYADMPENQQIMLSECLGSTWNAMQALVGDRFLMMLDAFQGDDVQMPTVEQIEKRIIMSKIASEFKLLRAYSDEDQSIDSILEEMAETHKTTPMTIREILRLASMELQNAHSEHAFTMCGESADHVLA